MLLAGGSNSGVVVKNNAAGNHVQPYYHPLRTTAMPFHNHPLPFYGFVTCFSLSIMNSNFYILLTSLFSFRYTPTYIVTDINYNYNQVIM